MARLGKILLHQHGVVPKAISRFALRGSQGLSKVSIIVHLSHALATTASDRFEQNGITYGARRGMKLLSGRMIVVKPRHQRHTCRFHNLLCRRLRAHRRHRIGGRTNKNNASGIACSPKISIFREKAIAWVDGLRASF